VAAVYLEQLPGDATLIWIQIGPVRPLWPQAFILANQQVTRQRHVRSRETLDVMFSVVLAFHGKEIIPGDQIEDER
jgi:hypothetical protein